jgi:predicted amidohydrolase YtcJ
MQSPSSPELNLSTPNLILYNANIITINPYQPRARAIAISGERILALGEDDAVRALANSSTRQLDLGGSTVVPGFIDAHCHVLSSGLLHLRNIECNLGSIPAIQAVVRARAAETPPGEWVVGFLYDDTKTAERRFLSRRDLDEAAPEHPVYIVHRGGHTAYVNSLAFEMAGITEETEDPSGGRFEREPDSGRLNGRVCENAMGPFNEVIPQDYTQDDYRQAVKLIAGRMNRAGITSAHDMWVSPEDLAAYQAARRSGDLSLRVYCMMFFQHLEKMLAAGVRTGLGDEWVRVGGAKLMCDGSISERTARLNEPYVGRPEDYGILVTGEEKLYEYASRAHRAGWQIGTHANGDYAIDLVLRIYERLQREHPRPDPRFRIEHCTVVNDDLIRRIQALGAVPTPFASYVYYRGEIMAEYGAERVKNMFALRSLLDAGITAAPGSDYPPGPFEPMMALQSAVTRTDWSGQIWGPEQRISVEEAIRCATLHGAYASYEEGLKGSLEPGKLADLVVLGQDPLSVDPLALIDVPVERTMAGGRWVYEG